MDGRVAVVPPLAFVPQLDDARGGVAVRVREEVVAIVGPVDGDVEVRQVEFNSGLWVSEGNANALNALTNYSAFGVVEEDGGNWRNNRRKTTTFAVYVFY